VNTVETIIRGRLKALSIADVLLFLKGLNRTGRLSLEGDGVEVALDLRGPWIVRAASNRPADSLEAVLVQGGAIDAARLEAARIGAAAEPGTGLGRALIAAGVITPKDLVAARREQARRIVLGLFDWREGEYRFDDGRMTSGWSTPVDLPIADLVADGIRHAARAELFLERLPSPDWVFEAAPGGSGPIVSLDTHEARILDMVDGDRPVGGIEAASEFPPAEVRRVLFLLLTLGRIRPRPAAAPARDEDDRVEAIVTCFNGLFGRVYQYMTHELGPISENLLRASLEEVQRAHEPVFGRTRLAGDGTLDRAVLEDNLRRVARDRRRETLVEGLSELLYRELFLLRQTLGPDHERRVLHQMRRDGLLDAAPAGIS
jgi:hypothetical protein